MIRVDGYSPRHGRAPQILFVHDTFPGQFGALAEWLAQQGWNVWFATSASQTHPARDLAGVRVIEYDPHRGPAPQTHPYAQPLDRAALVGQACARACLAARPDGLRPDLVVSHTGPGAGLYLGEVFPRATRIAYCEWWYQAPGVDVRDIARLNGQTVSLSPEEAILEHSRNVPIMAELLSAGRGLSPTRFQVSQFPEHLRHLFHVAHDGVDCQRFSPGPAGQTDHPDLARLGPADKVVSYATRGMEPHRGFQQVTAAIAKVQAADPKVRAVIAGDNRVHYGGDAERRIDWKERAITEAGLDLSRTHFTGTLSDAEYIWLLRRSDAHVYATVPFVLSWSMLDAMSCATPLILSDTAPVREFANRDCALFADLHAPDTLSEAIRNALGDRDAAAQRARLARARVEAEWSQERVFPAKAKWLAEAL